MVQNEMKHQPKLEITKEGICKVRAMRGATSGMSNRMRSGEHNREMWETSNAKQFSSCTGSMTIMDTCSPPTDAFTQATLPRIHIFPEVFQMIQRFLNIDLDPWKLLTQFTCEIAEREKEIWGKGEEVPWLLEAANAELFTQEIVLVEVDNIFTKESRRNTCGNGDTTWGRPTCRRYLRWWAHPQQSQCSSEQRPFVLKSKLDMEREGERKFEEWKYQHDHFHDQRLSKQLFFLRRRAFGREKEKERERDRERERERERLPNEIKEETVSWYVEERLCFETFFISWFWNEILCVGIFLHFLLQTLGVPFVPRSFLN